MRVYPLHTSLLQLLVSLGLLFKLLHHQSAMGQRLPTRDEEHFHFQISNVEIFYDTKLLPDGSEVSTYLLKGIESRYFFMVEEDDAPLSLTVSPCSSVLHWYVSYQELPQEGSADGTLSDDEDELFQQHAEVQSSSQGATLLQNFTSETTTTYVNERCKAGIYSISLTATNTDSSVRIYATTTPFSDQPYPMLPSDPSIKVMSVTPSTVTLAWKPSPTQSVHNQEVNYCVTVNKKQNFGTLCAAETFIFGENPPTPPPNAGFGFAWEKEKEASFQKKARPKPPADPRDVLYACVGSKTTFTFIRAIPGQQYFFDVFAVNRQHNTSSAYLGTNATTMDHHKLVPLKDGKVQMAFLKWTRPQKSFGYVLESPTKDLLWGIKPCSSKVRVKISNDDGLIQSQKVKELSYFRVANPKVGTYQLQVTSDRSRTASLQVFVTSDGSKDPYPLLPNDTQIKVYDKLSSCSSITVGWQGTARRQQYCLYMHKHGPKQSKKRHKDQTSGCMGPHARKKTDKVSCRYFRARNRRRALMTETIQGLDAETLYMFDVYVQKPGGQSLSYQRLWASTKASCKG